MLKSFKSVAVLIMALLSSLSFHRAYTKRPEKSPSDSIPMSASEANVSPRPAAMWSMFEVSLNARSSYLNPYTDVTVAATFTGPSGSGITKNIQGFWDGGGTFRVRFTPTVAGTWTYSIKSSPPDAGLTRSGIVRVSRPDSGEHGFLRRDPSSPYDFTFDDHRTRYFMMGQTYYNIIENVAGGGTWQAAIRNSKAYGFNKVRILLYSWGPVRSVSGALFKDIIPYRVRTLSTSQNEHSTGDHDVIDILFWRDLDRLVSYLKSQSMIADIVLFSDGRYTYGTNVQNQRYIRYALARLAGQTNVIWCMANEYDDVQPWATETEDSARSNGFADGPGYTAADAQMSFLANILRTADPYFMSDSLPSAPRILSSHQHSAGAFRWFDLSNTALATKWFTSASIQYHTFYPPQPSASIYGDVNGNKGILTNRTHNMPVVNEEYSYTGDRDTRSIARNALWGIVMGGGYGTFGGDLTPPSSPIFSGEWVDQPLIYGDIKVMINFMTSIPYWKMTPMNNKVAGLSGSRVYALGVTGNYVVYAANGGTFTFNGDSLSSCSAERLDPRVGSRTSLGLRTQTFSLTTPADNQDYVYHFYGKSCH